MAKELPYFKFEPSEWDNGNIQMLTREDKGLFIDLCAVYWSRLGELPFKLAVQKLCGGNAVALNSLCNENIISIESDHIVIKFLDEQLCEFEDLSNKNKQNALKGWENRRKKKLSDANATASISQSQNDAIREEERREEKKREKEIIEESIIISSKDEIESDLKKQYIFLFDEFWKKYDKKVDREKCLKKWMKLKQSEIQQIFENIEKYVESTPDKQFRKNPLTYLNSKSYENEIITKSIGGNYNNGKPTVFERHVAKFKEYQQYVKENNPFAFPRD